MTQSMTRINRLGLLGANHDPFGQLLEDLHEDTHTEYLIVSDPFTQHDNYDSLLVLSQDYALAHMSALIAGTKPCKILLRRARSAANEAEWLNGLELLSRSLELADAAHITLHAMTESAAEELERVTAHKVVVFGHLSKMDGNLPIVPIRRDDPFISFDYHEEDGTRRTRQARLDAFNWTRLRRLGRLFAADRDDKDMEDLVAFAGGDLNATPPTSPRSAPTIIAVVPNGVGLGHVTRMMAIAKALNVTQKYRVVFWCFSRAAAIVQAAGFEVILRQTAAHLNAHPPDWRQWETVEFAKTLRQIKPNIVAYDGAAFDPFMLNAMRMPGCGRVGLLWVRRGMMRAETDTSVLDPEQYSDLVLEPGDLAAIADHGPTRTATAEYQGFSKSFIAPPITLKPYLPAYSRREALKRLGLGRGKYCLVSLGGAFGNWDQILWLIKEHAQRNRIKLIWAQSPLSQPPDSSSETIVRQFYPFSPYLEAFSGVISAAGYNSFHELMMGYGCPVLFAPTNLERLDDQEARATYAGDKGWADVIYASRPDEHSEIIANFMARLRKGARITSRPATFANQSEMTKSIAEIAKTYVQ